MKLGVLTVPLSSMTLEQALEYLSGLGVQTVELGAGGFPGSAHLDVPKLLSDDNEVARVKGLLEKYNIEISAISCHGNNIHPNKEVAKNFHDQFINAVLVAEKLGVDTVNTFSGCPGDCENSKLPNWVTCAWPDDFTEILNWQWNEVLIPYWKKTAQFCKEHNVNKIAFEMHPGFCVYNTSTLLRLREAVGDIIGANFDPSHLIWQGIDPVESIKALKGAIHHFHAKDTRIDKANTAVNGVLDTGHYSNVLGRSWVFRTVGYGLDTKAWKEMLSTLAATGYNGAVSIEHEDSLMSVKEGLEKAIAFLKDTLLFEEPCEMWWA
jgi:sugar phosphate isomerase/epimerase